jgi:type I restriction enzyme M protein
MADFVRTNLFAADDDQFLVRAAQMNIVMSANAEAGLFHMNSLEFPRGEKPGAASAAKAIPLGSIDVLMTNPPFGADIPVNDPHILRHFDLAHTWEPTPGDGFRNTGRLQASVPPEILFVEQCVKWIRPSGRLGIVVPNGILGNPGNEYIRHWIVRHCWVLASVELPVEAFLVDSKVNILPSLLFLKKKPPGAVQADDLGAMRAYPIFFAVADNIGFDRRGNVLYRRSPIGEELVEEVVEAESIRIAGRVVTRTLKRKQKVVEDDLPRIAEAYREFRKLNPEPGA